MPSPNEGLSGGEGDLVTVKHELTNGELMSAPYTCFWTDMPVPLLSCQFICYAS